MHKIYSQLCFPQASCIILGNVVLNVLSVLNTCVETHINYVNYIHKQL